MVFSTAFGTAVFGYLIDIGLTIKNIAFVGAAYILLFRLATFNCL